MGCIINWDAKNTPQLAKLNVAPGGCIVNWVKDGAEVQSLSKLGGCLINWDAATEIRAGVATGGCIVDWDAKTDIASLSRNTEALGCLINWMGVDRAKLEQAALGGCIIDW